EDWRVNLVELRVSFEEALSTAMMEWSESPFGPHPFDTAIRNAVQDATRRFDEQRVYVQQLEKKHADEVRLLQEQRERVSTGTLTVQNERPGGALWQLCDFVDGLDHESRAGIEAGLQAAGLLKAWVTPSGDVLDPEDNTPVLVASTTSLAGDEHLGTMLTPSVETDRQVPPEVVANIFRRIGAKPDMGHTWITANGRWQNGLLHGRSQKPAAEHIGAAARELARQRRVAELDSAIAQAEARCRSTADSINQLSRREQALRQ